jgi:hypothetical protein
MSVGLPLSFLDSFKPSKVLPEICFCFSGRRTGHWSSRRVCPNRARGVGHGGMGGHHTGAGMMGGHGIGTGPCGMGHCMMGGE